MNTVFMPSFFKRLLSFCIVGEDIGAELFRQPDDDIVGVPGRLDALGSDVPAPWRL